MMVFISNGKLHVSACGGRHQVLTVVATNVSCQQTCATYTIAVFTVKNS